MATDLDKVRAFARDTIATADSETINRGVAGASRERAKAEAARALLALLDSLPVQPAPALAADEVRAVVREAAGALLDERKLYIVKPTTPTMNDIVLEAYGHGRACDAVALQGEDLQAVLSEIADRVSEKLAGRVVAALPPPTSPDRIPPAIRAGLDRYHQAGIRPGGCVSAILANDLVLAFACADPETRDAMPAIVAYVACQLPADCHGSQDIVERWIARPRS